LSVPLLSSHFIMTTSVLDRCAGNPQGKTDRNVELGAKRGWQREIHVCDARMLLR
jgi:hypothetical protein